MESCTEFAEFKRGASARLELANRVRNACFEHGHHDGPNDKAKRLNPWQKTHAQQAAVVSRAHGLGATHKAVGAPGRRGKSLSAN